MIWTSSDVAAGDDVLATDHNTLRADMLEVFDSAVPLGSVTMWAGDTTDVPSGWHLCNGTAISRTTYSDLYALLGNTFGSGNGSTTFNVPDMRDRFVVGAGSSYSRNSKGGSNTVNSSHSHTVNSHSHSISQHSHTVSSHRHYTSSHSHTVSSHTHSVPSHSHGNGSLTADIFRSSQYNMYINHKNCGAWASDYLINLYNSSASSIGHSTGTNIRGVTSTWGGTSGASSPGTSATGTLYTSYSSPGTTTAGATSTGSSSPSTNSAGSSSLENRPPYIGLYYIIKTE